MFEGWDLDNFAVGTRGVLPVDLFDRGELRCEPGFPWSLFPFQWPGLHPPPERFDDGVDAPIVQEMVSGRDQEGLVCLPETG